MFDDEEEKNNFHVNTFRNIFISFGCFVSIGMYYTTLHQLLLCVIIILLSSSLSVAVTNNSITNSYTNTDSLFMCDFNGKMPLLAVACGVGGSGADDGVGSGGNGGNSGNINGSGSVVVNGQQNHHHRRHPHTLIAYRFYEFCG